MTVEREREMAEAIARAEEQDRLEDGEGHYARPQPPRAAPGEVYTFRMPKERRDQLRESAARRGVPPATLIRQWVEERLDEDSRRIAFVQATEQGSRAEARGVDSWLKDAIETARRGSDVLDVSFIDIFADRVHSSFPPDRLRLLAAVGGLAPSLAVATRSLQQTIAAALSELSEMNEVIVAAIDEAGIAGDESQRVLLSAGRDLLPVISSRDPFPKKGVRGEKRSVQPHDSPRSGSNVRDRHVVPNQEGGWDVRAPGAKRASSRQLTKTEAVRRARQIVRNAGGGSVVVHDAGGRTMVDGQRTAARK